MDDLFDFAPGPESEPAKREPAEPRMLSVTELTRQVRDLLEGGLGTVWVAGEIGNYRKQASGHQYFTLKDERCQLSCVLFHRAYQRQKHPPLAEGMQVQVRGQLSVYEVRGQYQLNVSVVQPAGTGLLAAKFEALKLKLEREGLFDPARKRPLPRLPQVLGLVTSPTGAALRDMLQVLARRAPWVRLIVSPTRVQGEGAAREIVAALELLTRAVPRPEAIVVGRGGGSLEDLWEFNEEALARAIAACPIPVISAVGHEIDFTIADFVADLRAPTPSAAAELAVPEAGEMTERLRRARLDLERPLRDLLRESAHRLRAWAQHPLFREPGRALTRSGQRLDQFDAALRARVRERFALERQALAGAALILRERSPARWAAQKRERLTHSSRLLKRQTQRALEIERARLEHARKVLAVLAPAATLARGFSITQSADGKLVTDAAQVAPGETLVTTLSAGQIHSTADGERAS